MSHKTALLKLFLVLLMPLLAAHTAVAQGSAFTYQGRLTDGGAPPTGTYELEFKLFDAASGGTQQPQPSPVTLQFTGAQAVAVTNGVFTVQLDFGADAFPGAARYLEMGVRHVGNSSFTTLSPRQPISSTPYAVRSISAATAVDFSGSLAGDVTGAQGATVVGTVGGQSAANVASGASAANAATNSNTAGTIVKRDASGNFSAGTITASLDGNASTATTANSAATANAVSASAGDSVVTAVNASASSITTAHVSGDVELLPAATQTATQTTGTTRDLVNAKLIGTDTLGTSGNSDLLSLSVSGTYHKFQDSNQAETRDVERFRFDNSGGILAQGDLDIGTVPTEGSGTRFMFLPYKASLRAGYVNGTQWDDANIGYYSFAFGNNARASGDNAFAAGQDTVAAGGNSTALGQFCTATGAASVALGYYAHTNSRQGSFVFSDRSIVSDGDIDTGEEDFKAASNHSFNVRASGGYYLYTNSGESTGLRMSSFLATGGTPDNNYGSFVWTDRSSDSSISPTASHQTIFRSSGGYWLYSNSSATAGVTLAPGGGSWTSVSDRNMKANFAAVDTRAILRGVLSLPISTWNYKSQDTSVRHIGPMAQDFFAAFKLGEGDKTITTVDPDGVALAAIQGLHEELKDRDVKIEGLQRQVKQQQGQIDDLKKLLCLNHADAPVCKESR